jgi:hypothetical protein
MDDVPHTVVNDSRAKRCERYRECIASATTIHDERETRCNQRMDVRRREVRCEPSRSGDLLRPSWTDDASCATIDVARRAALDGHSKQYESNRCNGG